MAPHLARIESFVAERRAFVIAPRGPALPRAVENAAPSDAPLSIAPPLPSSPALATDRPPPAHANVHHP
jgi:hypothetical protein